MKSTCKFHCLVLAVLGVGLWGCHISDITESSITKVKVTVKDASGAPAGFVDVRLQDNGWGFSDSWIDGAFTNSQGELTIVHEDEAGCLANNYTAYAGFDLDFDLTETIPCGEESEIAFTLPVTIPDTLLIYGVVYNSAGERVPETTVSLGRSVLINFRNGVPVHEKKYFHSVTADAQGNYRIEKVFPQGCGAARFLVKSKYQSFSFYCFKTDSVHRDIRPGS